jgi:hypothetical protein
VEGIDKRIMVQGLLIKNARPYLKNKAKYAGV